ncbi:MAG: HAMP domain-containing histidine kinase [Proteobacteria bacterium]|nr:HAMP domain-containing histidine kinase [Pseudomonadota bacterium]
MNRSLLWTGLGAGLVGILLVSLVSRRVLAPVRNLSSAALRLGQGDLSQRVAAPGRDEIGQLARSFNSMAEELESAERQRRSLMADVAHELRTPLAVLRSHLDNLENTETIQSLSKDVDAMSRLVSQLLATTQLDSLTLNPNDEADLHAIGTEVAKYMAPFAIKEGRSIEMTGTQDPVIVRGNDEALEMAVRNLVENALRYSARETVVTIHVSDEPAISVINRGRGIPPEQQEVIFQRFKRSDRRSGGAGLGLSIVQRVVEAHQATIDVSDAPGGGTIFKISFPFHKSLKVVAS